MTKPKILVTGSTGKTGGVVRELLAEGFQFELWSALAWTDPSQGFPV